MEHLTQLENLLESGHRLITIETDKITRVGELLLELGRFSPKPYYFAEPQQAMYRVGVSHIGIPRTQDLNGLTQHIESSKHFGIFILSNYSDIFDDAEAVKRLSGIASSTTPKVVVMIAQHFDIPEKLKPFVVRSQHKKKNAS